MNKFIINSESSGKYHHEKNGGRDFLVTTMLPIQANSIMNGLFYPVSTVSRSYSQLEALPAPAGHPFFNGRNVSALDPEGASSFVVGAFVRNPVLNGLDVTCELVIDTEVADQSPKGQEIISRIKNKKRIGISTGGIGRTSRKSGKVNGVKYSAVVDEIYFDHVAILLNETPAGENTYTLNSSAFFNPQQNKEGPKMREITIDTSNLSLDDHKFLEAHCNDPAVIVNAIKHDVTESEAETVLTNAGKSVVNSRDFEAFMNSREDLKEFTAKKEQDRYEQIEFVVNNSKMTQEQVQELSDLALESMVSSITPANKHIRNGKIETPKFTALEGA